MRELKISANPAHDKARLGDYLKGQLGFSASLVRKVKYGNVYLNGKAATMRDEVTSGDSILVCFPEEASEGIAPLDIPLEILYEDDCILAVNKPVDMPVHPSRGNHLPTLANAVLHYMKPPFVFRAVNRLDRDTSGIVVIAKDAYTAERLGCFMRQRRFEKIYLAIVTGIPAERTGRISAPIERMAPDSIKRTVRPDGKEAITDYEVIGVTEAGDAICRLHLHTGRTHQIRVHMAYIGHPLYSDFLYGKQIGSENYRLHCTSITFPHPVTEQPITISSEPDFLSPWNRYQ
jgi:23S rRNA pseudouridine1911/1915/1917 synthase